MSVFCQVVKYLAMALPNVLAMRQLVFMNCQLMALDEAHAAYVRMRTLSGLGVAVNGAARHFANNHGSIV